MQVVVKTPRIRLEGEVTDDLVDYLRKRFGEIEVIEDDDEELVKVTESDWYRSIKPTIESENKAAVNSRSARRRLATISRCSLVNAILIS